LTVYIVADPAPSYAEANAQPMVAWDNLLARGTIASGTLPTGAPRLNAVDENTTDFWQPTGADTLRATMAGSEAADCAFFAAHTLSGRVVKVQYFNGSIWVDQATVTPTDNDPFLIVFPTRSATGWGISVDGACIIGVAWVGPRIVIPGGVVPGYTPVWAARSVKKWGGGSRRGHWLGQRVDMVTANLSPQFMPVPYAFAFTTLAAFRARYNEGRAFVWASAPSVFTEDCAYCWAEDGESLPAPISTGAIYTDLSMNVTAYCEP
jgi:hypothetical protein